MHCGVYCCPDRDRHFSFDRFRNAVFRDLELHLFIGFRLGSIFEPGQGGEHLKARK